MNKLHYFLLHAGNKKRSVTGRNKFKSLLLVKGDYNQIMMIGIGLKCRGGKKGLLLSVIYGCCSFSIVVVVLVYCGKNMNKSRLERVLFMERMRKMIPLNSTMGRRTRSNLDNRSLRTRVILVSLSDLLAIAL